MIAGGKGPGVEEQEDLGSYLLVAWICVGAVGDELAAVEGGRRRSSGGDGEERSDRGASVEVWGGGGGAKSGNVWVEDGGPRRARARRRQWWWRRLAVRTQRAWILFRGKGGGGERAGV